MYLVPWRDEMTRKFTRDAAEQVAELAAKKEVPNGSGLFGQRKPITINLIEVRMKKNGFGS